MEELHCESVYSVDLPFPLGIIDDNRVYLSGRTARDPETGDAIDGIAVETDQILSDIELMLESAGTSIENVIQATVYLEEMSDIGTFNEIYESYMTEPYPARSAVEVSDLAVEFSVEVEMVARRD
jgi:2-iminobutanoate/2-iminopropanoate deaminase